MNVFTVLNLIAVFMVHNCSGQNNDIHENEIEGGTSPNNLDTAILEMENELKGSKDECDVYNPTKPDFLSLGHRISQAKCLDIIWDVKITETRLERESKCTNRHTTMPSTRGVASGTSSSVPRITHGKNANFAEFPHMGAVGWPLKNGGYAFMCNGFLISENFLITAAHCQGLTDAEKDKLGVTTTKPKIVRLGVNNIKLVVTWPRDVKILEIITHPQYDNEKNLHDIALIKLRANVQFSQSIRPVCLWADCLSGITEATVTGWGKVEDRPKSKASIYLKKAVLRLLDDPFCDFKLRRKTRVNHEYQICASQVDGDTCHGDSGGALHVEMTTNTKRTMYIAFGVTSKGFQYCGTPLFPSLYTKIPKYIDWIEEEVWGK